VAHDEYQELKRRKGRGFLMGMNLLISAAIFFIATSSSVFTTAYSSEHNALTFKKQPEIQQIKPQKPVKIKLKRLANGTYTWDLTGDNVQEILRIDRELRKQLHVD
jgi:hypothetical protein